MFAKLSNLYTVFWNEVEFFMSIYVLPSFAYTDEYAYSFILFYVVTNAFWNIYMHLKLFYIH